MPGPGRPHLTESNLAAALSNEFARRLLSACMNEARSVKEMGQDTALPQATVYRHVATLVENGLLFVERSAITADGKRYDLFRSIVQHGRIAVDGSGVRVLWEPLAGAQERLARTWNALRVQG